MTEPSMLLRHDGTWKHLWLKYIDHVDTNQHCARSLLGSYDKRVGPRTHTESAFTLDRAAAPLGYYLCGVSKAGYRHNFHLAFTAGTGTIRVGVEGASRLAVMVFGADELQIRPVEGSGLGRQFTTCRNWQHAMALERALANA